KFPERLKPISLRPNLTDLPKTVDFNDIFVSVSELNLAIYTPSDFILPSKLDKYTELREDSRFGNLSRAGRERGIRQLMSINLLKRLESSVNSFRLTLKRIRKYIATTIEAIDSLAARQSDTSMVCDYDFSYGLDFDEREDTVFIGNKKTKIDLEDMDYIQWRDYLAKDLDNLNTLLFMLGDITPEHDSKLQMLLDVIREKFTHPINGDNRKVIIFTAFSDTAQYIYGNIKPIIRNIGGHTGLVSGDNVGTSLRDVKRDYQQGQRVKGTSLPGYDFNKVLTLFSPISKDRATLYPNLNEEIDVLIATDCISEGQNLQDCDYLINYDIHWNPVRIIQRFGRIDRIGSRNEKIQLVNFWQDMDLDDYIDLKGRVEARMKVSVLTATGDDNPLTIEEQGDLKYRRDQLERLKEEVVDIEEMNTGVSIMDLGLNEFRLDLLEYMRSGVDIEHTPLGLHALTSARKDSPQGVIFVLKNRNNDINIDKKNRLHPFYMVYISKDSDVIVNHLDPKGLLDRMRQLCRGKSEPIADLCRKFNAETREGQRMGTYSRLLGDAISSLIKVKESSDLFSFLDGDSGSLFGNEVHGLDDFELICFLIVR
ncbi:MAG: ATP-dependent helicase, partial [Muribaculaceae bacterium]|nr:ATP-dependent helicase [Muribaculaceae bacterium]